MKNAEMISGLMKKLNQSYGGQWEKIILGTSDLNHKDHKEVFRLLNNFADAVRQELKTEESEEVYSFLQKEGLSDEVADKLMERVKDSLRVYIAVSLLRELEKEDKMSLKMLLLSFYQKYIVRLEAGYLEGLIDGVYDKDNIFRIVNEIQYLTEFYISRQFTLQGMIKDLAEETGLSQEICTFWADLIEQNYTELKMNYIVNELARINRRLSKL